MYDKKITGKE